jgi:L-alanine-DL-glutamate epimerase-like enolase superfamily enzyme
MAMIVETRIEELPLKRPFRITGKTFDRTRALIVLIGEDGVTGWGEAEGVFYNGETAASILDQAQAYLSTCRDVPSRAELREAMPPGGARNAIDCALWDLEAKRACSTIWTLTDIRPRPLTTVFTIGLEDTAEDMAIKAAAAPHAPVLKIKLDNDRPVERIEHIRRARPDADLVIDANCAWSLGELKDYARALARLGVAMIEQPLPRGQDGELEGYASPVPLCADESCLHGGDLDYVADRYALINIKLDKTGGLTEALDLARAARERGLGLMVGNMMGGSLAMAPSFVIGCLCRYVDLDGPLFLERDMSPAMTFNGTEIEPPSPRLWG